MPIAQDKDTLRVPLVGVMTTRDGTNDKDQLFYNCVFEDAKNDMTQTKKLFAYKRPGLTELYSQTAGEGRGMIYWAITGKLYYIIGDKLYSNNTVIHTLDTTTGPCGFVECYNSTSFVLFLADGTNGHVISTSDTVTHVNATNYPADGNGYTGADLPTPHIPQPSFLDGYVFLIETSTGKVFNSKLTDPGRWRAASDYVTPIMFPDKSQGLARQANQLVVFKEQTSELYYDQGASGATGSPLGRTEQAVLQVGCSSYDSICQNERFVLWVGKSHTGGAAVWQMDGFTNTRVSTAGIERLIQQEDTLSNISANLVRTKGNFLYVMQMPTAGKTLVYDVDEKMWTVWGYTNPTTQVDGILNWSYGDESATQTYYVLGDTDGKVYYLDPDVYTDNGVPIKTLLRTHRVDMENNDRKFLHKLTVIGDTQEDSCPVSVQWSDDDYQTFSVGQQVNMRAGRAVCYRLGSFRRRVFQLTHTANTPFRV